ncbi:MAG: response regulator [Candidatus Moraniibacteriota bacterium]
MAQKTVLIVDDNPDIREIYRVKFEREGFGTRTAEDGEKALHAMRAELPDAILLDLQMPIVDGLEVLGNHERRSQAFKNPSRGSEQCGLRRNVQDGVGFGGARNTIWSKPSLIRRK